MAIDNYHIKTSPVQKLYYVPDYITLEEESDIISEVNGAPKPKWTQLAHRRLQNWGGIPHAKGMIAEKIPTWLTYHTDRIAKTGLFGKDKMPNHVLINEYQPGQGIMPHADGSLFYPTVTTISCGSHTMLDFYKACNTDEDHEQRFGTPCFSLLLERRSLLVLQEELYTDYLHAIAEVNSDKICHQQLLNSGQLGKNYLDGDLLERGVRISLTIRHVARTSKFKIGTR